MYTLISLKTKNLFGERKDSKKSILAFLFCKEVKKSRFKKIFSQEKKTKLLIELASFVVDTLLMNHGLKMTMKI